MENYRIRATGIESDTIEGEAVVIDMESGKYYCLNATGSMVWEALRRGVTADGAVAALALRCEGDRADMRKSVDSFLKQLENEALIERVDDDAMEAEDGMGDGEAGHPRQPFTAPVLDVFTDMQAFMLVDPVHEVDEQGIPQAPPE